MAADRRLKDSARGSADESDGLSSARQRANNCANSHTSGTLSRGRRMVAGLSSTNGVDSGRRSPIRYCFVADGGITSAGLTQLTVKGPVPCA
jgi:hypothetical protein